ncbi:MAG: DUF2147 domain-containing protein [Bacteroidetes bacterium]|nr:DUF2147 domain-containing protein [Bacteroidota bacterium]MCA6442207.1 DUF2147 domain-containing protein [Bacteroidota bacterium]
MKIIAITILFITSHFICAQSEITGVWLTQDKEVKVEIYENNGKYFGKSIWLKNPNTKNGNPRLDERNPNQSLRKRSLLNLVILTDFIYEDKEWIDGRLYDPNEGETYSCKMWLENPKVLKVRGYVGFLYETETWTKLP